jgi:hypothetical protein
MPSCGIAKKPKDDPFPRMQPVLSHFQRRQNSAREGGGVRPQARSLSQKSELGGLAGQEYFR